MIDTAKVTDRRELRFATLEEAVRDAEALAAADADGRLRRVGNWSLGEAVTHVAFWANAPFDGYPPDLKVPWLMKFLMKFLRGGIFKNGMKPGIRMPNVPDGTFGAEDVPAGEAVERLRSAFARIDEACPPDPSPLFGKMSHDQWRQLNLRHAELHFGFYHAQS